MNDDLLKMFSVDKFDAEPLHLQLRRKLTEFIRISAIGDKLPAERIIAEAANVNRETVRNAIKDFLRDGVLKRGRGGTVIMFMPEDVAELEDFHPLLSSYFNEPVTVQQKTLRLSLFETWPNQKRFWTEAVNNFNSSSQAYIVINWIERQVATPHDYLNYVNESQPDIFLLDKNSFDQFNHSNLLLEIPNSFREGLEHEDFYEDFFIESIRNKYSIPLHFSPRLILWNLDLADKLGVNVPENIGDVSELLPFFNSISGMIPDEDIATGNIWDILVELGFPTGTSRMLEFFKKRFNILVPFIKNHKNLFFIKQKERFEAIQKFLRGEMLCYAGNLFTILQYVDRFNFRFRGRWTLPEKGYSDNECCTRIGLHPRSPNIPEGLSFIKSLFSENISRRFISTRLNCSYRRNSNMELKSLIPGLDINDLDQILKSYVSIKSGFPCVDEFMTFKIRDLYCEMLEGRISVSDTTDEAYRRFMEIYL